MREEFPPTLDEEMHVSDIENDACDRAAIVVEDAAGEFGSEADEDWAASIIMTVVCFCFLSPQVVSVRRTLGACALKTPVSTFVTALS